MDFRAQDSTEEKTYPITALKILFNRLLSREEIEYLYDIISKMPNKEDEK